MERCSRRLSNCQCTPVRWLAFRDRPFRRLNSHGHGHAAGAFYEVVPSLSKSQNLSNRRGGCAVVQRVGWQHRHDAGLGGTAESHVARTSIELTRLRSSDGHQCRPLAGGVRVVLAFGGAVLLTQRMLCAWVELRGPPLFLLLPGLLPPICLEAGYRGSGQLIPRISLLLEVTDIIRSVVQYPSAPR